MRGRKPDLYTRTPNGKKPETPEYRGDDESIAMQTEEYQRQGIELTFFEYRQEIGTAQENQRSDLVEHVQKGYRDRDHTQRHHERRMSLVNPLE